MTEHGKKNRRKTGVENDLNYRLKYLAESSSPLEDRYLHGSASAAMDIYENAQFIFVEIDLAGVDPKALTVAVVNDKLTIEGKKGESVQHEPGVVFHCAERNFGAFRRVFGLGSTIDSQNIEAKYENGVLLLKLPKVQDRRKKAHHIKVQIDE